MQYAAGQNNGCYTAKLSKDKGRRKNYQKKKQRKMKELKRKRNKEQNYKKKSK